MAQGRRGMDDSINIPSADEFRLAFIAFMLVASSVAFHRGRKFGPERMAYIARQLANEFAERFTVRDAERVMAWFGTDLRPLGALYEEFIYIACRYSKSASDAGVKLAVPGNVAVFAKERGNVFSDTAVNEIETVKGSISWLLEKLPKWAQRIVEALMEALKLTRGHL